MARPLEGWTRVKSQRRGRVRETRGGPPPHGSSRGAVHARVNWDQALARWHFFVDVKSIVGGVALRSLLNCVPVFLLASTYATAAPVQTLTRCDDLSGWSRHAELSNDAYEGSSAIVASVPSGQIGFVSYDLADAGLRISHRHSLSFWWKTEGNALRDLRIRVRDYPLAGGRLLEYRIWSGQTPPRGWQLAVVELAKPLDGPANQDPLRDRRYITFRAVSSQDSAAQLFIDHIVSMDRAFSWRVRAPRQEESVASVGGSRSDQTRWRFPAEFENHTPEAFWISVRNEGRILWRQILRPGTNEVLVPIPPDLVDEREDPDRIPLTAQVLGFDHTRSHWMADLRQGGISQTWEQFVSARQTGSEPILPDYSYAGYRYFEEPVPDVKQTLFNVTWYGATPDDGLSDQSAIVRAIAAAEANGGGTVLFPPGQFLVNTDADRNDAGALTPIYIRGSRIVLKGSGSRRGGTIIRQVNYMPPTGDNLYSSPYMFNFRPGETSTRTLATVSESARRESFWLTVADSSRLRVGQRVVLDMNGTAAVNEFLVPRLPGHLGPRLQSEGLEIGEEHSIAEIQGDRIRLNEPLHTNVNQEHDWTVRSYPHLEEIGVEDISFHGSFLEEFVHHKNAIHDGGWSLLALSRCVNSWIRRVSFVNTNRALNITRSAAVSVYHLTLAGNTAHASINSQDSYGVWVGLSEDLASHLHGIGASHASTGTVFWRFDMGPKQSLDIHKTKPSYANLYDQVGNGRLYGSSGGGVPPHHLRHLVFWNFNHGGDDTYYDFWQGYLRFLHPIVIGFHGNPATFNERNLEVLESNGTAVKPDSLFEAQLNLRLSAVPVWLDDLRREWEVLRDIPLPDYPAPDFLEAAPQ